MNTGDEIDHNEHGRCIVTHVWLDSLGVVPGRNGKLVIISKDEAMKISDNKSKDTPHDANGERLEVGDLVVHTKTPDEAEIVREISGVVTTTDKNTSAHSKWTKITALTPAQYLPLARRTLSDELRKDDRLRLAYLALGFYDELLEFQSDQTVDEAGDVLWYADQFIDELRSRNVGLYHCGIGARESQKRWTESIKKGAFHLDEGHLEILLASACAQVEWIKTFARQWGGPEYTIGHIRLENIKKLYRRHPDGWSGVDHG